MASDLSAVAEPGAKKGDGLDMVILKAVMVVVVDFVIW